MDLDQRRRAGERFRELHEEGVFVLFNVADAATASAAAEAGAVALATSSAAHAAQIGRADAAGDVSLEEHASHTEAICAATVLPVNVDAENGYGHEPDDVASCVRRLAAAGASGAGIEDWSGDPNRGFYDRDHALARVVAAVEAAEALAVPFTVTGRTECLLYDHPGGMEEALARLRAFSEAGAHCLYAPFMPDLDTARTLVSELDRPLNVLAPLGRPGPTVEQLAEAGVRRISIGGSLFTAQVARAHDLVGQVLETGSFTP